MIVEYLRKLQDVYRAEKNESEKRLSDYRLQIKENREFVKVLKEESDPNYESFTPREVHPKNKEKILELQEKEEELQREIEREEKVYQESAERLDELESVLKEALQYEVNQVEIEEREKRKEEERSEMASAKLESLIRQIELCSEIVELDPRRCKIELGEVLKEIRSV